MLNTTIKQLRIERGLNQVQLAKKLSVTKQTVSNWENDNILPSIEMLIKIADFFNVSTDYLLGRVSSSALFTDGLSQSEIAHISMIINDIQELKKQNPNRL